MMAAAATTTLAPAAATDVSTRANNLYAFAKAYSKPWVSLHACCSAAVLLQVQAICMQRAVRSVASGCSPLWHIHASTRLQTCRRLIQPQPARLPTSQLEPPLGLRCLQQQRICG